MWSVDQPESIPYVKTAKIISKPKYKQSKIVVRKRGI